MASDIWHSFSTKLTKKITNYLHSFDFCPFYWACIITKTNKISNNLHTNAYWYLKKYFNGKQAIFQ